MNMMNSITLQNNRKWKEFYLPDSAQWYVNEQGQQPTKQRFRD